MSLKKFWVNQKSLRLYYLSLKYVLHISLKVKEIPTESLDFAKVRY